VLCVLTAALPMPSRWNRSASKKTWLIARVALEDL
jgi:hypothetical protein